MHTEQKKSLKRATNVLDMQKLLNQTQEGVSLMKSNSLLIVNAMTLFLLQMIITGGLGIPGTRKERSTRRNTFVSFFFNTLIRFEP